MYTVTFRVANGPTYGPLWSCKSQTLRSQNKKERERVVEILGFENCETMDFVRRAVMVFGSDLWKRICSDSATKVNS